MLDLRICKKCNAEKDLSEYHKRKWRKDSFFHICKTCSNEIRKSRTKAKRDLQPKIIRIDQENQRKLCPKCDDWKPFSEFSKNKREKCGISPYCRICYSSMMVAVRGLRRSRMKGNKITNDQYEFLLEKYLNKCVYCFSLVKSGTNLNWDHYIPIALGGENSLGNIVPSCSSCNNKKNKRTPKEFFYYVMSTKFLWFSTNEIDMRCL